ncbi:hypothetical protein LJC16_01600 [Bacteroidales bacterium OttesenSCG-928-C19]|nr:hypothetical protein [Bacteroidales bacterium OttesenSCG-928-C19]
MIVKDILSILSTSVKSTLKTCAFLFKIMIPVSILLKILQSTGWIVYVGQAFAPLMQPLGLPGEMGLVWATSLLGNIFGGILVLLNTLSHMQLSIAQMSVLTFLILIAHTLIIETTITYQIGIKIVPMILFRLILAYLGGLILNLVYSSFGILQEPANVLMPYPTNPENTIGQWILNELQRYGTMMLFIFGLVLLLEILKKLDWIKYIERAFAPFVNAIGISAKIIPMTIIGITLGLAYGGALIIKESRENDFSAKDIFYAIFLMAIFHSIIEDSLLMLSLGGHYSSILIFRTVFTFLIMFCIVRFTKNWNDIKIQRYFFRK